MSEHFADYFWIYWFLFCSVIALLGVGSMINASIIKDDLIHEYRRSIMHHECVDEPVVEEEEKQIVISSPQEVYESPKSMVECLEWNEFLAIQNGLLRAELGIEIKPQL